MSTNALIGLRVSTDLIRAIYCHYDGNIEDTGKILYQHYNDFASVEELINGGGISVLEPRLDAPPGHSFKSPVPGHTIFYHRDRGEPLKILQFRTLPKFLEYGNSFSYVYLFEDGDWLTTEGGRGRKLVNLAKLGRFPPRPVPHHELYTTGYDESR